MAGLKLPGKKGLTVNKKTLSYLSPKSIYIPLYDSRELLVNVGDTVSKGEIIAYRPNKLPIFSSVSGKVTRFEDVHTTRGVTSSIVIENNKQEKIKHKPVIRKELTKITKEEFISILKNSGIIGMGGAGFPTFMKYDTDKKINTLIINAAECEPYITADYVLIKEKIEDILETIDAILEINNIKEAIIGIKAKHKSLINKVQEYMGSYLKIKLVLLPDKYPMGWERTLIKEVTGLTYDKLPIEKGIVVNNISTIYAIAGALKYDKPLIERIVTFTGDGLYKPKNVLVKVGTKVSDIFEELGIKNDSLIIAGGPMMGKVTKDDLVVTPDLNNVLVLRKYKECKDVNCLRCGKCASVCPAYLVPVLIKDNIDNVEKIKELNADKCISCGLCSYVCPSKINVRDYIEKAKQTLKERK